MDIEMKELLIHGEMQNTKWISVKDEMPKADTPVLVFVWDRKNQIKVGQLRNDTFFHGEDEGLLADADYSETGKLKSWISIVTHWMPLPEPPKESKP